MVALLSRLLRVNVPEMDPDSAMRVCMAKTPGVEYKHGVFFSFAAIEKAVSLSQRYLHDNALPEKALDVLKEAAVLAQKQGSGASGKTRIPVTAEHVAQVVHGMSQVPVEAVTEDESSKLLELEDRLHERIIGQDAAVTAVAQAMRRARAELREGKRPIANFLFLGPTGVGKTELSKALAAEYFGSENSMVRVDMSEYQDAASVARMIGASGDERGGLLTEAVRRAPFTIVLLDEIEKAHPDILNLFLQVMDDGRLTDGVGRTVDFTQVVLIATSNAGTQYIQDETRKGTSPDIMKTGLLERELKGIFRPEFLNRFDAMIVFSPLSQEAVQAITRLMLKSVAARLEEKGMGFRIEEAAVGALATLGYDPAFGARPLRRVIQDRVDNTLADLILRSAVKRRDTVVLRGDLSVDVEKAAEIGSE
jgi:ATP-dependent Clp protease ATP-binding subunit ClpA